MRARRLWAQDHCGLGVFRDNEEALQTMKDWFDDVSSNPRSLFDITRLRIREIARGLAGGRAISGIIDAMNFDGQQMPKVLQSKLTFKYAFHRYVLKHNWWD